MSQKRPDSPVRLVATVLVGLALVACQTSSDPAAETGIGPGADSPEETVMMLVEALSAGEFDDAVPFAMPGHAALASLAEGATFGQVADALRDQDPSVAANFWGGFAQGAGDFLTEGVTLAVGEIIRRDGIEYRVVKVLPESGEEREMMTRDQEGFRVDIFSSFAPGLAERMVNPVERLIAAQTPDSRLILSELRNVVPSLLVAAERPDQPPSVVQSVLRLVELITRVG